MNQSIHVLGAGSIGILWTASIRSKFPKYPIKLLLRDHERNRNRVVSGNSTGSFQRSDNQVKSVIQEGGNAQSPIQYNLQISWNNRLRSNAKNDMESSSLGGGLDNIALPIQFIKDPIYDQPDIQTLIVATKAHQAKQAFESILDRLVCNAKESPIHSSFDGTRGGTTNIILLCNGALSVREQFSKILEEKRITTRTGKGHKISLSLATTTHGAYLTKPNELYHAGVGTTFLEDSGESSRTMVDLWNSAGLECKLMSPQEMETILWKKLAANCVINPLTAIFRCTNGDLLMEPSYFQAREEILNEVAMVGKHFIDTTSNSSRKDTDDESSLSSILTEMREFVSQTIEATKHNQSSMYQDVLKSQRTTEVDHLNGYIVRKGRKLGFDCPTNENLCSIIASLTSQHSR